MARQFSNSNEFLQSSFKTLQPPCTLAIWINTSNAASFQSFFNGGTTATLSFDIVQGASWRFLRTNQVVLCTGSTPENLGWSHLLATHSGTGQQQYLNGVATGSGGTDNGSVSNSGTGYAVGPDGATTCNLADAAIWNVVLTAGEILALGKGARPNTIRPTSLVAWWPLDGLVLPEPDLSGNVNNMALVNTPAPTFVGGPPVMMFTPPPEMIFPRGANQTLFPGAGEADALFMASAIGAITISRQAEADALFTAPAAGNATISGSGEADALFAATAGGVGRLVPVSPGLDTTLVPGKWISRRKYQQEIERIRQEALAALAGRPSRSGLSDLEIAELDLFDAETSYKSASEALKTNYSRKLYEVAENTRSSLRALEAKVSQLRTEEARSRAIRDAKDRIRQQVKDAIARRRS